MQRRSRFDYSATSFTTILSAKPWTPGSRTVGGRRIAASGAQASYVVRRDSLLDVPIRFYESEWLAVANLIEWGQDDGQITWYPDADDTATSFTVYLDSHAPAEDVTPERNGDFPRVFEITLRLRAVGSGTVWTPYFSLA